MYNQSKPNGLDRLVMHSVALILDFLTMLTVVFVVGMLDQTNPL